jgi:tetratricopeptide (TPR) repeat protein
MWRTQSIFVSSTFSDMEAERDLLRNHVFPALEERLRERRVHVEWVDLRVGIVAASIAERDRHEAKVLQVCFEEVDRCHPFMVALIGERYGWVPPEDRLREAAGARSCEVAPGTRPSVTAAEMARGLLSDATKRRRSFVYVRRFRTPPPYARMSDEERLRWTDTLDPASAAARGLAALERRLRAEMPRGHVRDYAAAWDDERDRVVGLDAFGDQVLHDLLGALEAETTAHPAAERSWQEVERDALEDFVEDRARAVVGRDDLIDRLAEFATRAEDAPQGVCITGDAGAGKSALFGVLFRRLSADDGPCVLAHAAGAGVGSGSVDRMLRRWVGELFARLGRADALPADAQPDAIDAAFASLLAAVAARQRVVVLVDALDQFERTARARVLAWLPRALPANVRLVATAAPGDAADALGERPGIATLALPPIDEDTARRIIAAICARYHRALEPEVVDDLLERHDGGRPCWENPLWLVLAVEDLNLIDADDLAEARRLPGGGSARVRDLMRRMVKRYPADIARLYAHTFERPEVHIGTTATRAFLRLIAISRGGLRALDFEALMPRITGKPWSAYAFAQLRRMFRGQLRAPGALRHWDFNHAQMRRAVRERLLGDAERERELHAQIAFHLLELAETDALRESETMVHLIGSESWRACAAYLGDAALGEAAAAAAGQVLADAIAAADDQVAAAGRIARLLDAAAEEAARANAAHRLLYDVAHTIRGRASLAAQQRLLAAIDAALARVAAAFPSDPRARRDHAAARGLAADVAMQAGAREAALDGLYGGLAIAEAAARDFPHDRLIRSFVVATAQRLGDALFRAGRRDDALAVHRRSLAAADDLVRQDPGSVMARCAQALSLQKIAACLVARAAFADALGELERSIAILEEAAARDPAATEPPTHLAQSCLDAGLILVAAEPDRALAMLQKSLQLRERLAAADPDDMTLKREIAVAASLLGDALQRFGRAAEAREGYRRAVELLRRIAASDRDNLRWRHDLSIACRRLGGAEFLAHRPDEAAALLRAATELGETLVAADPSDRGWRASLAESLGALGYVLNELGCTEEAAAAEEKSARLAVPAD